MKDSISFLSCRMHNVLVGGKIKIDNEHQGLHCIKAARELCQGKIDFSQVLLSKILYK